MGAPKNVVHIPHFISFRNQDARVDGDPGAELEPADAADGARPPLPAAPRPLLPGARLLAHALPLGRARRIRLPRAGRRKRARARRLRAGPQPRDLRSLRCRNGATAQWFNSGCGNLQGGPSALGKRYVDSKFEVAFSSKFIL